MTEEIRKHARFLSKIQDPSARNLETAFRARKIAKHVTPEFAERLMNNHPELVDLLEAVWLYSTSLRKLGAKKKEEVTWQYH